MESLYLQIARRIDEAVDGIAMIDEETGQLIETGDAYPVLFPCVLIDLSTIDWGTDNRQVLRGTAQIVVKHAFDCVEDTHLSSQRFQQFAGLGERCRQHRQLQKALHGWRPGDTTPLVLTQSRHYTLFGRVKVYEETFTMRLSEDFSEE